MVGGVFSVIVYFFVGEHCFASVLSMFGLSSATLPAADAAHAIAGPHGRDIITRVVSDFACACLKCRHDDRGAHYVRNGTSSAVLVTYFDCQRRGTPQTAMLLTATIAAGLIRNRDISTTHRDDLILSGSELLPLLPRPNHTALSRTRGTATVPGLGVSVVGLDRRSWGSDFFGWNHGGDTLNGLAAIGLCAVGLVGRALIPRTISPDGKR